MFLFTVHVIVIACCGALAAEIPVKSHVIFSNEANISDLGSSSPGASNTGASYSTIAINACDLRHAPPRTTVSGCDERLTGSGVGAVIGFAVRVPLPASASSSMWSVTSVRIPLSQTDISSTFYLSGYQLAFFADDGATIAGASTSAPFTGYPLPGARVRISYVLGNNMLTCALARPRFPNPTADRGSAF